MDLETTDVHQQVMDMILGFWASQTLRAIADFSVADHLAAGGLTAAEVAAREGTAVDITYRLMRAGVGLGFMTTDAEAVSTQPNDWLRFARMRRVPSGRSRCPSPTLGNGGSGKDSLSH